MADRGDDFSGWASKFKQGITVFAESYAKAVKSGGKVAGKKILKATQQSDSSNDEFTGKVVSAVKSGVRYAGEQLIKSGIDFVQQMKEKSKKP